MARPRGWIRKDVGLSITERDDLQDTHRDLVLVLVFLSLQHNMPKREKNTLGFCFILFFIKSSGHLYKQINGNEKFHYQNNTFWPLF